MKNVLTRTQEQKITRVEVIDETGRILVLNNCQVLDTVLQDDERTLKIFVQSFPKKTDVDAVCTHCGADYSQPASVDGICSDVCREVSAGG